MVQNETPGNAGGSAPTSSVVLTYAAMGLYVFPVAVKGGEKTPLVKWREVSTTDAGVIRSWWTRWSEASIGIDCGKSKLVVVDLDVKDGKDGPGEWKKLTDGKAVPATFYVRTPSGGWHLWFRDPDSKYNLSADKVAPGVDIRAVGGLVVAPGSDGYTWLAEAPLSLDDVPAMPDGIIPTSNGGGTTGHWKKLDRDMLEPQDRAALEALEAIGGHSPYLSDGHIAVTRPGKVAGASASIGHIGPGIAKVFTPNWPPLKDQAVYDADQLVGLAQPQATTQPALEFATLADLCARVDGAGPRQWLIRGIWPGGAYGVHAAEMKAQKTWNALDLAVSVASGTPWLDHYPVDDTGPVVIFAGEGGAASIVRRLRAICASRGLHAEDLPITICMRAPHLSDLAHMIAFREHVEALRPKLVELDPLYLAMGGADGKDLYAMGQLLERPQILCDQLGASFIVVTHFNRGQRTGAARITGAGPAEWGRVLIGAEVLSKHTDSATKATTVLSKLDILGGEVPDQAFRVKRVIAAEDPDDLDSPLTYSVKVDDGEIDDGNETKMPPARRKLLEAVRAVAATEPQTGGQLVDWIAATHGHGLTRQTTSTELNALLKDGLVDRIEQPGREALWTTPSEGVSGVVADTTRQLTTGDSEGVVAVVAHKATATPDTPDDTPFPQVQPARRECTVCNSPLDPTYVRLGRTTHPVCRVKTGGER
jgi:hypothetical protein